MSLLREKLKSLAEECRPWPEENLLLNDSQLRKPSLFLQNHQQVQFAATKHHNPSTKKRISPPKIVQHRKSSNTNQKRIWGCLSDSKEIERNDDHNKLFHGVLYYNSEDKSICKFANVMNYEGVNEKEGNLKLIHRYSTLIVTRQLREILKNNTKKDERFHIVLENTQRTIEAYFENHLIGGLQAVKLTREEICELAEETCQLNINLLFSQNELNNNEEDFNDDHESEASSKPFVVLKRRRNIPSKTSRKRLFETPKEEEEEEEIQSKKKIFSTPCSNLMSFKEREAMFFTPHQNNNCNL